jgi:hypothetical protein
MLQFICVEQYKKTKEKTMYIKKILRLLAVAALTLFVVFAVDFPSYAGNSSLVGATITSPTRVNNTTVNGTTSGGSYGILNTHGNLYVSPTFASAGTGPTVSPAPTYVTNVTFYYYGPNNVAQTSSDNGTTTATAYGGSNGIKGVSNHSVSSYEWGTWVYNGLTLNV